MDILPQSNEQYSTKEYWNTRYNQEAENGSFDWFKSYAEIADIIRELIPDHSSRILMLGCGNSRLSEEMYDDGYKNIVNIDYSSVVIDQMQSRHKDRRPEMEWLEMDVRSLRFQEDSFDVAIDKGTMDAMLAVKGDIWNPPQQAVDDCTSEVEEVVRVLKKGKGLFIYLTFGQPHFRKKYLSATGKPVEVKELGESFHYYLYTLRT